MNSRNKYMKELLNNSIGWGDTLRQPFCDALREIVAAMGVDILAGYNGMHTLRWKLCGHSSNRDMDIIDKALEAGAFDRLRLKRNANDAINDFATRLHRFKGMSEGLARNVSIFLHDVINGAKEEILITPKAVPGKVGDLIERGNASFVRGQYQKAVSQYTAALKSAPENITALYNRGVALSKTAKYHLPPNWLDMVIWQRSFTYSRISAKEKDHFNKVLEKHDEVMKSAIDDFSAVLKLKPKNTRALILRGEAYYCICDFKSAMADFNTALKINPRIIDALIGRSDIYTIHYSDDDKAIADYNTVLEIDPQHEKALKWRKMLLERKERQKKEATSKTERIKSIGEYTAILRGDPGNIGILNRRGIVYRHNKEYDKAVEDHSAVLRIDPENIEALCNRGLAQQDHQKAIADFTAALELNPNDTNILRYRSWKYQEKKKYHKALDDLDTALSIDPQNTDLLMDRGLLFEKMGEMRDAYDDYNAVDRIMAKKKK